MLQNNIKYFYLSNLSKKIPIPNRELLKKFSKFSFYKRKEPDLGINFISDTSKLILEDCIKKNTANPFFELIDQYCTQSDPAFCGSSNLMIILNTLKKDPNYKWKGIWRWYDDRNIKCMNVENVLDYGITLSQWALLLKCNGISNFKIYRPLINNESFNLINFLQNKNQNKLYDEIIYDKIIPIKHTNDCKNKSINKIHYNLCNEDFFRVSSLSSCLYNNFFLMCNLGRKALGQTGDGHFTPIGAYHQESDNGLLIESARFKYNSRWFKINNIYKSLLTKDSFTQKNRGFLLINKKDLNIEPSFSKTFKMKRNIKKNEILSILDNISDNDYKNINNDLEYKAKILDCLFSNKKGIQILDNQLENEITNKIIEKYNNSINFKKFVDFLFFFDNNNVIDNLVFTALYHLNIQH